MKSLSRQIQIHEAGLRKPMPNAVPLLDEGCLAKTLKTAPPALAKETKPERMEPKPPVKKGLSARQYAAIFSFVMMATALLSQAAAIIGCTNSAALKQDNAVPAYKATESSAMGDSQSNATAPMASFNPPYQDARPAPVSPKPGSESNYSLP